MALFNLYIEIQPSRFRNKIEEQGKLFREIFDLVHIPDAPLGYPKASPLAIGAILIDMGLKTAIHLRVVDYNEVSLLNQYYGAYLLGIDRLLVLRGDKPVFGGECNRLDTARAVRIFRNEERLSNSMKIGVLLSMKYDLEKIKERVSMPVDFFLIINKDYEKIKMLRRLTNKELVGYMVVETEKNRRIVERVTTKDVVRIDMIKSVLESYEGLLDSILFSIPGDYRSVVRLSKYF